MKTKMMLALVLGASFNAAADDAVSQSLSGFYAGGYYSGQTASEKGAEDANFGTLNVLAGYQFNEIFSLEARYGMGVKGESESWTEYPFEGYSMEVKMDVDIDSQYALLARLAYPVSEEVSVYGLAGYSDTEIKIDSRARIAALDFSESGSVSFSESGLAFGMGVDYKMQDVFTLFLEYQVYPKFKIEGSKLDLDGVNLGVTYKF